MKSKITVEDLYKMGDELSIKRKIVNMIIAKITGLDKSQLFLIDEIQEKFIHKIKQAINAYNDGEPLEYILKHAEFYSLGFYVDESVLIPRIDTELLVDKALTLINKSENIILIDIGTGSGCIPISVVKNTDKVKKCYAVDISEKAIMVAGQNVVSHGLKEKINLLNGNLLDIFMGQGLLFSDNKENVVITANLPYIKKGDHINMSKCTVKHEPDLALYGGNETGFELYKKLIKQCLELVKTNKLLKLELFIEIGFDQYEYSKSYLEKLMLKYKFHKDTAGIYRCIQVSF